MGFGGQFADLPAIQPPVLSGTLASRPLACYRNTGTIFVATDTAAAYYSTGKSWIEISGGGGGGGVSSVTATAPIASSGGTSPNITHDTSGATAGSYTNADITIDQYGHVTAASNGSGGGAGGGVTSVDGITGAITLVASGGVSITNNSPSAGDITIANTGVTGLAASGYATLAGSVTLAAGSGVTLSESGQTITIAASGGSGGGVTSLAAAGNAPLTGAISLASGSNITLSESGNTITIAASGGSGSGTVTSIATTSPITGGTITTTGTISHATSGVTAGTYSSPTSVVVDQWGHVTSITAGSVTNTTLPGTCNYRLSVSSSSPVGDGTSTVLYAQAYKGNTIALYNGTSWDNYTFSGSGNALSASGLTVSLPYDVFAYVSGGNAVLEAVAWTNGTTRATALGTQNGAYVLSTDATKLYLGTVMLNSSGDFVNTPQNRLVWNYYNRLRQSLYWQTTDTTWSWLTTGVWRQANADPANQVSFVVGVEEDDIQVRVEASCDNTSSTYGAIGLGLDSTTANSATVTPGFANVARGSPSAEWLGRVLGYHYIAWLEWTGTASGSYPYWYGVSSPMQSGMTGSIMC